jgi:hypothetical protein
MATRTRSRPEWPTLNRTQRRKRRRKKVHLKVSPTTRKILAIAFALLSLVFLALGLLTETVLWYLVMALSAGATLAQRRALQMQAAKDEERRANRARPQPGPKAKPMPSSPPAADPQPTSGLVVCTDTGKPVEQCDCASRHVATSEGSRRYGLPVGSPIGRRKKTKKPSMTTSNQN